MAEASGSVTLNNGVVLPLVLYGSFLVRGYDTIESVLDAALGCGYRGIDTAAVYCNEEDIGKALNTKLLAKHGLKRQDIFITSKLGPSDQGYESALAALNKTLSNLGTDYLDLYLIHWPGTQGIKGDDPKGRENRRETWKAFEQVLAEGKARSIGVSNYMIPHLEEMKDYAKVMPAVNQCEFHPLLNQQDLMAYCRSKGIFFQAYSSLGTSNSQELLTHSTVQSVAKETGKTPAQVLLRWAVQQGVGVLPKSISPGHIEENLNLFDWYLSEAQVSALSGIHSDRRFCWDPNNIV